MLPATLLHLRLAHGHLPSCHYFTVQLFVICVNIWIMLTDSSPVFSCLRRLKWILSSKSLIKPQVSNRRFDSTFFHQVPQSDWLAHVSFSNVELLRPCFVSQCAGIAPPVFHFAMGWNCSAHVSFRNGLELLRPCFVSQLAGITPPTFYSSVVLTVGIPADLIFQLGWDTSRCHSLCLLMRGWDTSWLNLSTRLGYQPMSFFMCIFLWLGVGFS